MSDKERKLGEIEGIIEDSEESEEQQIEALYLVIKLEGEENPVTINVKDEDLRQWIENLINQEPQNNIS